MKPISVPITGHAVRGGQAEVGFTQAHKPSSRDDNIEIRKWFGYPRTPTNRFLWLMRDVPLGEVADAAGWSVSGLHKVLKRKGWAWAGLNGSGLSKMVQLPCFGCRRPTPRESLPNPWTPRCHDCS